MALRTSLLAPKERLLWELWEVAPEVRDLLRDSRDLPEARERFFVYLVEKEKVLYHSDCPLHLLEIANVRACIRALKNIIAPRNERATGYSALQILWNLARDVEEGQELAEGFFEEFIHLLAGANGRSGIYEGQESPAYFQLSGREAALRRSDDLDDEARSYEAYLTRYPSGLEPAVIKRRRQNVKRIRDYFGATSQEWQDHRWHMEHLVLEADTLKALIELTDEEEEAINIAVEHRIPFGVTPYYVSLMDVEPHRRYDHAVRAQVIPPLYYAATMRDHMAERNMLMDFMREHDTSPIDLVTRRYPMIAIVKPYNACTQVCVYCQRNWEIEGPLAPGAKATEEVLDAALDWFKSHRAITDVLITGGDPLVLEDEALDYVLKELSSRDNLERIRIGTRLPVVLPQRITDRLVDILGRYHLPGRLELCIVSHYEHPYEVTPESMEAVQKFKRQGMSVYNQQVFTTENSRRFETVALRRAIRLIGVEPYYAFNAKGKEETKQYRVPIARLLQERKEEARLTPGISRTDEPVFNIPGLGKNHLRAWQDHEVVMIRPDGRRIYEFHPWEKNLKLVSPHLHTDVPIHDYLAELERRGENLEDYRTIWYYY